MKKHIHAIRIPILNDEWAVYVIWGEQKTKLKWLRWHFDDDSLIDDWWSQNRAITHYKEQYIPVINIIDSKYFYAEIAHEACHAIDFIFKQISDDNRGELFAHSVGAVVRLVTKYKQKNR